MGLLSDENDPGNLIKGQTLDLTRVWGWFAAGLGMVGPSILVLFKDVQDGNEEVVIGAAAAVMVATVIAIAIAISADLRARATVTAAETNKEVALAESWRKNLESTISGLVTSPSVVTVGQTSNGTAGSAASTVGSAQNGSPKPIEGLIGVTIANESQDIFMLLAVRYNKKEKRTEYLVARSGAKPVWKADMEVESVTFPYQGQSPESEVVAEGAS